MRRKTRWLYDWAFLLQKHPLFGACMFMIVITNILVVTSD